MSSTTNGRRAGTAAGMLAVLAAAAALVGCDPTGADGTPAGAPAPSATITVTATAVAAATAAGGATTSAAAPAHSPTVGASGVAACTDSQLKASDARDSGPGAAGFRTVTVEFTNTAAHPCTVKGFPAVAAAGQGSPDKSLPLRVQPVGTAAIVQLAPGARVFTIIGLKQVLGEADGYCTSGATPFAPPSLVLGVPDAGRYQVAMSDGSLFAECDDKVTATPFALSVKK